MNAWLPMLTLLQDFYFVSTSFQLAKELAEAGNAGSRQLFNRGPILSRTMMMVDMGRESNLAPLNFQLNCIFSFLRVSAIRVTFAGEIGRAGQKILNSILMDAHFESNDTQFKLD